MIRCYLPTSRWMTPEPLLEESESRHLTQVLRIRKGERIGLLDGAGQIGEAEVLAPHKKHTVIRILDRTMAAPIAPRRILAQALVREQPMDWLIQKAVELGVHEIWPLQTERSVVKIRAVEAGKKAARWQAIALAACKQSGNPWLPRLRSPQTLTEAVRSLAPPPAAACFGALQPGAIPLPQLLGRLRKENCPQVTMFIGPEGDFSPAEVRELAEAGISPVTFGPIVFRVETAALFILSALHYAWLESSKP